MSRMSTATAQQPATLQASFRYYSATEPPDLNDLSAFLGSSSQVSSLIQPVTDLRSFPAPLSSYSHETHGFQILNQKLPIDSSHDSVHDEEVINMKYYPAMVSVLKKQLGIRAAAIVNHTLRDVASIDMTDVDNTNPRSNEKSRGTPPFFIAHSDYTAGGARSHLRAMTQEWTDPSQSPEERELFFHLKDEILAAEDAIIAKSGLGRGNGDMLRGTGGHWDWDGKGYDGPRYAIFSIWRPWETVKRDPLALIATPESELQFAVLPRTYKDRPGHVKEYYSDNPLVRVPPAESPLEWYYLSDQKPEEIYAIKLYDSEAMRRGDGSIRSLCPHSAFRIEGTEDAPPRRSSELRVWCIW
ncbi:hypothetical protein ONS95_004719 [Cadophora gregata]|uniref:uncharacterized protein n=1 Tax=Cadophora gregata TaxID=51156 RepID=UPI0026DD04DB|nr:uncharacterized protein ONS95_004719 [Cadophora gregata]KAK0104428.1 hypothetical protein ONS95_004719 [Cadophora gregata]